MKKILSFLLAVCLIGGGIPNILTVSAAASKETVYSVSGDKETAFRSRAEIAERYKALAASDKVYDTTPSVKKPYSTGKLADTYLESAEAYLNFYRYIAGLPLVEMQEELNTQAQYGATLLAANDKLTHYPDQPSDMDKEFYEKGYASTTSSNVSMARGYSDSQSLINAVSGCMDDTSAENMKTLGHRRWLMNPVLRYVGFGKANSTSGTSYTVTQVFDRSGSVPDYDFLSWPASGNFPNNILDTDVSWSVSLNPDIFEKPSPEKVQVTIVRKSDGKTWKRTVADTCETPDAAEAYFQVENSNYGVNNCIIFNIGSSVFDGDKYEGLYTVTVTGLDKKDGGEAYLSYTVNFFDASSYDASTDSSTVTDVSLNLTQFSANIGDIVELKADVTPSSAADDTVIWTSDNTEAAVVDENGYVYAVGEGRAVITATAQDGGRQATCEITVAFTEEALRNPFRDVYANLWYAPYVQSAYQHKLIMGSSADTFEPNVTMTRAMFTTVLARMSGEDFAGMTTNKFTDVPEGAWYTDAVAWAVSNGMVYGTTETTFGPDQIVTREQMCTLLIRYAAAQNVDIAATRNKKSFEDEGEISDWASASVTVCQMAEIFNGKPGNLADPKAESSRAEAATLLWNYFDSFVLGNREQTDSVKNFEAVLLAFSENVAEIYQGEAVTLPVSVLPSNAEAQGLSYAVSDSDIITVDSKGTVTARKIGEAELTVTASGGLTATCSVRVLENKNRFQFEIQNGEAVITGYSGNDKILRVPARVESNGTAFPVTAIADKAFSGCVINFSGIVISEGIKKIGAEAFQSNRCNGKVYIPSTVESIGTYAFSYLYGCTGFKVSEKNSSYSSACGVLFDKEKITLYNYPLAAQSKSYTVPDSVELLYCTSFANCYSLESITVPHIDARCMTYTFYSSWGTPLTIYCPKGSQLENQITEIRDSVNREITVLAQS